MISHRSTLAVALLLLLARASDLHAFDRATAGSVRSSSISSATTWSGGMTDPSTATRSLDNFDAPIPMRDAANLFGDQELLRIHSSYTFRYGARLYSIEALKKTTDEICYRFTYGLPEQRSITSDVHLRRVYVDGEPWVRRIDKPVVGK